MSKREQNLSCRREIVVVGVLLAVIACGACNFSTPPPQEPIPVSTVIPTPEIPWQAPVSSSPVAPTAESTPQPPAEPSFQIPQEEWRCGPALAADEDKIVFIKQQILEQSQNDLPVNISQAITDAKNQWISEAKKNLNVQNCTEEGSSGITSLIGLESETCVMPTEEIPPSLAALVPGESKVIGFGRSPVADCIDHAGALIYPEDKRTFLEDKANFLPYFYYVLEVNGQAAIAVQVMPLKTSAENPADFRSFPLYAFFTGENMDLRNPNGRPSVLLRPSIIANKTGERYYFDATPNDGDGSISQWGTEVLSLVNEKGQTTKITSGGKMNNPQDGCYLAPNTVEGHNPLLTNGPYWVIYYVDKNELTHVFPKGNNSSFFLRQSPSPFCVAPGANRAREAICLLHDPVCR